MNKEKLQILKYLFLLPIQLHQYKTKIRQNQTKLFATLLFFKMEGGVLGLEAKRGVGVLFNEVPGKRRK
jgi:hypothetical protein